MTNDHENPNPHGHGSFERRDIGAAGVIYFFLGLVAVTVVVVVLLVGFYDVLDKRNDAQQVPGSPLVTNVPTDTRHVPKDYEVKAFPDPRLEKDERSQLNDIVAAQEQTLNSYSWVDEKSKTVRIPIERAMDLLAQRGLPLRSQETTASTQVTKHQVTNQKKGRKQ